jgi:exonuclease SbcC
MLKRLHLENFMAHEGTIIDLGPGLSVLTGPNNTGKSAVVEALRCLATNPPPRSVIRHGAKEARVSAEFEDGTRVTWIRRKTYAGYEILRPGAEEPEEFYKFGRTPPQAVLDVLRLGSVELEGRADEAVDVHIGDQRYPIFLLDRPPSAIAAFFASSSESAHLLAMQDNLKNKVRRERRHEADLSGRMEVLAADLDMADSLPRLSLDLDEASRRYERLERLRQLLPKLAGQAERIRELRARADEARQRLAVLSKAEPPAQLWPATQLSQWLSKHAGLQGRKHHATARIRALRPLVQPPQLFPAEPLRHVMRRMQTVRAALARGEKRRKILDALEQAPTLFPVDALHALLKQRDRLHRRITGAKARCAALEKVEILGPPPQSPDRSALDAVQTVATRLRALHVERGKIVQHLQDNADALQQVRQMTETVLETSGTCPLCGQTLDAETFLKGGHGHDNADDNS